MKHYNCELVSVGYIFCSDEYLKEMNKEHLDHDYYTDIITFNYNDNLSLNAEMFISYDRVVENANDFGNGNIVDELHRVVVHGLLHCIGYNDKSEGDKLEMTKQEDICLEMRNSFT